MLSRVSRAAIALAFAVGTTGTALAVPIEFHLNQAPEVPVNGSAGTLSGHIFFDITAHTMRIQFIFSGLSGNTSMCTAVRLHNSAARPQSQPSYPRLPASP
jgi:hypothetical protein